MVTKGCYVFGSVLSGLLDNPRGAMEVCTMEREKKTRLWLAVVWGLSKSKKLWVISCVIHGDKAKVALHCCPSGNIKIKYV